MSAFDVNDSIAAIASPPGAALRGVIRLSGPEIFNALSACVACPEFCERTANPEVFRGEILLGDPFGRIEIDLCYWPGKASYTRQRSAEIHCTGSLPVLNAIMRTLATQGVRQAQPGEFTLRAFLAGRIDLTRAEAVLGVIDSTNEREIENALKQLAGGLGGPVESLQDELLELLAHIEAGLDFVEEDIEFVAQTTIQSTIQSARQKVDQLLDQFSKRQSQSQRPRVLLKGRPNAGKSCLQNALTGKPASIVSSVAGTTRDYLTSTLEIGDLQIELIDTAGVMSEADSGFDEIQQLAATKTGQVERYVDLVLLCIDGSIPLDPWSHQQLEQQNDATICVRTKADLPAVWRWEQECPVSSVNGLGIEELANRIATRLRQRQEAGQGEWVAATVNRCFESLDRAGQELSRSLEFSQRGAGDEIVAASLRVVLDELALVTGRVFTDDILDRVFSRFCIGK